MIVLDTTIVNVALPSIRDSLGFSQTSLVWVVNAYTPQLRRLPALGRPPRGSVRPPPAVGVLWAAILFASFFISALYLQLVLGYNALHVGLAFLPESLLMAVVSVGVSAKLVTRFGLRVPLSVGLVLAAAGLLLLARGPVVGHYATDVLPSMVGQHLGRPCRQPAVLQPGSPGGHERRIPPRLRGQRRHRPPSRVRQRLAATAGPPGTGAGCGR